jgi:hypothetical protein
MIHGDTKPGKKTRPSLGASFTLTCRPLPSTSALQSTLAKSVFDALGGEANVTYLVHDSYYKGML